MLELLTASVNRHEAIADLRNNFRRAFQDYVSEGDRMAALLRSTDEQLTGERGIALGNQQTALNAALRRYEAARTQYVHAVMGQLACLSAMGLKIQ